ncbi:hypothetical protein [Zoogloea sp.]|uniref:hypothetical protein n=1 Tax=Zoogloea sp. TaxID=49181 RepID=UPI0026124EA9|nr:hypothetical protein [Zoogloea sp.]MDD3353304.1 hypothetical protein [Zoogloea sp.]
MSRWGYVIFGLVVVFVATLINLDTRGSSGSSSRGWSSGSGSNWSSGGGHK